ncbi:MAG: hypothetical protein HeimC3_32680 [Candidatus Heimdallarchaeota archaeon LC_3]|nr:MAG: hypothetical protein HeimC3_32680 [Candidatus Heimdallarchaeota archaeon LC_3]
MALKDNKIKSIIVDFVNYFNNNSIPYVLIGGLAVNIWGRIRTTMDADFIIDQSKLDIEEFLAYLQERKYEITSQDMINGLNERINITIWSGIFRVDLKGIYNSFAKKSIEMAHKIKLFNVEVKVDSPELLIISKLCYGSEQDFEDAASIFLRLKNQNRLNLDFLKDLIEVLNINDRLNLLESLINKNITVEHLENEIDDLRTFNFDLLDSNF